VDSQAALLKVKNKSYESRAFQIKQLISGLASKGITVIFHWVPSHMDIEGNEAADEVAKEALKSDTEKRLLTPLSFFKSSIKERVKLYWEKHWETAPSGKGKLYSALNKSPKLSFTKPAIPLQAKGLTSAYIQLKTGIGYLKSYQFRINKANSTYCFGKCQATQDTRHLILYCKNYENERLILISTLKKEKLPITLPVLFNTDKGKAALFTYLDSTGIGTAAWYRKAEA
jgi:hypothetical protein